MDPIEQLIEEHNLIVRMLSLFDIEILKIKEDKGDPYFIHNAVEFFITFGDKTHHGKEEDILFRELGQKPLSEEHQNEMAVLLEEHILAREKIKHLNELTDKLINGDQSVKPRLIEALEDISAFYLQHIEKENAHFFVSAREYLTEKEFTVMIEEFAEHDRSGIHQKYKDMISELETKNT